MDEIHVHKTKKSICAHFAESPCILLIVVTFCKAKKKIVLSGNKTIKFIK